MTNLSKIFSIFPPHRKGTRNFSLTLLYSEGNDIHQSTEKENVCSGRSFQCDYPTECVEEYNVRRWEEAGWDLVTGILRRDYPAKESGIYDWNYLSELDTFL